MNKEIIKKAEEIICENTVHLAAINPEPYCVLSLIDENGYPTQSTLTASKANGINSLTFCTGLTSNKAKRIEKCNLASVCFCHTTYNITLVGTIEIITDMKIKQEMWYDGLKNHFTGADDPNYCVLNFQTKRYNLFIDWQEVAGNI